MNSMPRLNRSPSPFAPAVAPGRGPERFRVAGPTCWSHDPFVARNIGDVSAAWELARTREIAPAIVRQTSLDLHSLLRNVITGLLMPIDVSEELNAGGFSALGVGPNGLPGTWVGLGGGYSLGIRLLEGLEAGFLSPKVVPHLEVVDRAFRQGVHEAWQSAGSSLRIRAAALILADAVGIFFSLLQQGLIAYLADELGGKARGRLREALNVPRRSKLFRQSPGLEAWTLANYERLVERFRAESADDGPGPVSNVSSSGLLAPRIPPSHLLPDISRDFTFREYVLDGKTYKQGSGRLGVPGRVRTHRSTAAQREVSEGSGDDAGHLIGNRFGAPGGAENLSTQNWIANRYGSFKNLENSWAEALRNGSDIDVVVTDVTLPDEDRPFMRKVEWTETHPDGKRVAQNLTFANMQTAKSRTARGIAPTTEPGEMGKLIEVDFKTGKVKEQEKSD